MAQGSAVANQPNRLSLPQTFGVKSQFNRPGRAHQNIPHSPSPLGTNIQAPPKPGGIAEIDPARPEARQQIGLGCRSRVDPADPIVRPLGPTHIGVVGIAHPHAHQANARAPKAIPKRDIAGKPETPGVVAHFEQVDPVRAVGNQTSEGRVKMGLCPGRIGDGRIEHDAEVVVQGDQAPVIVDEGHGLGWRVTVGMRGCIRQGDVGPVGVQVRGVGNFLPHMVDEFAVLQRLGHAPGLGEEGIPHAIALDAEGIQIDFGARRIAHLHDERERNQGVVPASNPRRPGVLADFEHPVVPNSGCRPQRDRDDLHLAAACVVANHLRGRHRPAVLEFLGGRLGVQLGQHVIDPHAAPRRRLGEPHAHQNPRRAAQNHGQGREPNPHPRRQAGDMPAPGGIETQQDLLDPAPGARRLQVQAMGSVASDVRADFNDPLPGQGPRRRNRAPTLLHPLKAVGRRRRSRIAPRRPIRERGPAIPVPPAIGRRYAFDFLESLLEVEAFDVGMRGNPPIVIGPPKHIHPGSQGLGTGGVGPHGGLALAHGAVQMKRHPVGALGRRAGFGRAGAAPDENRQAGGERHRVRKPKREGPTQHPHGFSAHSRRGPTRNPGPDKRSARPPRPRRARAGQARRTSNPGDPRSPAVRRPK